MTSRKVPSLLLTFVSIVSVLVIMLVCVIFSSGCGLQIYDPSQTCDGYTLICKDAAAHLLDMNGNEVKTWNINSFPAKMFPDGSVMGQGGFGEARLELSELVQYSWDGELVWKFTDWEVINGVSTARVHHDFQRDGNPVGYYAPGQLPQSDSKVLVLAKSDVLDPEISDRPLMDDIVYEVDWLTQDSTLLWQASEHFNELGFSDEAKQLVASRAGDYLHINSVSRIGPNKWYDPETGVGDARFHPDNLIMDSREANIIWIVNMVESTAYDIGEIVWRVGPDYSSGTPEGDNLGQIIGQHHAHMIPEGLPGAGNILVFDNGGAAGYPFQFRWTSRILEFDPNTLELMWKYEAPNFFSFYISSAQRLPNGNTLIDEGSVGRIFEVTPAGEIVWEYVDGAGIQALGRVYRAYRVPPEWVPGNPRGYKPWSEYETIEVEAESTLDGEPGTVEDTAPSETKAEEESTLDETEAQNPPLETMEPLPE